MLIRSADSHELSLEMYRAIRLIPYPTLGGVGTCSSYGKYRSLPGRLEDGQIDGRKQESPYALYSRAHKPLTAAPHSTVQYSTVQSSTYCRPTEPTIHTHPNTPP